MEEGAARGVAAVGGQEVRLPLLQVGLGCWGEAEGTGRQWEPLAAFEFPRHVICVLSGRLWATWKLG